MRQVDSVIIIFEICLECQSVVEPATFPLHGVLVVADVWGLPIPTNAFAFCLFDRVDQRFHSLVVGAFGFDQVNYVEFVSLAFLGIFDWVVEPLGVIAGAIVILQNQIILVVSYFDSSSEITTFEPTFKH